MQISLLCLSCYNGSSSGFCCLGFTADTCNSFEQEYICEGGLVHNKPVTREICYECAKSCSGCMTMRVAFGFADKNDPVIAHILQIERRKKEW